jgi:hypothetical protein
MPGSYPQVGGRLCTVATIEEIDELVAPATPQFAYQIRARVRALVLDLPEDNPVRRHAEDKMELLDRLGHASSKADDPRRESPQRPGWAEIPSSATADSPLPPPR